MASRRRSRCSRTSSCRWSATESFRALNRPVTSDARSNQRAFDGRVYVIVLDDLNISPLRTSIVKQSAREFVERHFGANDLAAVVYTSGRAEATQDFTNDRALLVAAIDKFAGRRLRSAAIEALERHYQDELTALRRPENYVDQSAGITDSAKPIDTRDLEREQRALAVLDTLRNLGEFLSGVRGRRKAVLMFSEGLEMPMSEIYGIHTATDVVGAIKDAITAAARSNVNFFTLDPRGLIGMTSEYIEASAAAPSPENTMRCVRFEERAARAAVRDEAVAGQPSHARRRDRRIRGDQPEHARLGLRPHRRCEQPVLRAGLLPSHDGARRPVPSHRGPREAPGATRLSAPRICIAAGAHAGRTEARRRHTPGARREARRSEQYVARAARRAQCPAAAERPHPHSAGGAVQEHAEGGVGRAGHRV